MHAGFFCGKTEGSFTDEEMEDMMEDIISERSILKKNVLKYQYILVFDNWRFV